MAWITALAHVSGFKDGPALAFPGPGFTVGFGKQPLPLLLGFDFEAFKGWKF